MLRKSDFLWLGLAAFAGVSLFHTSYRVQSLKDEKIALERQIVNEQDGIQVLKAEWSFLNDPARLEQLAASYLALKPIVATQIAGFEVLPARPTTLPASLTPPPASPATSGRAAERAPAVGQRPAPIATLAAAQAPVQMQPLSQGRTQPQQRRPVRSVRSASAAGPSFAVAHVSTRSVATLASGREDIGSLLTRLGRPQ
ncbi:MAG: hypothetical protein WCO00_02570 [Rhodospirillaceae bacterium]